MIQFDQDLALGTDSFTDRKSVFSGNQWRRDFKVDIIMVDTLLIPPFQDIPKPFRGQECCFRPLALNDRVGPQGCSMNDMGDLPRFNICLPQQFINPLHDPYFRLVQGCQNFR